MKISCTGTRVAMVTMDTIASGAINYFEAQFTFDSAWSGLNFRWGVFKGSGVTHIMSLTLNGSLWECIVPLETISKTTDLYVGAIGCDTNTIDDATTILTTHMGFACKIYEGASTSATTGNQDQTMFQTILQAAMNINNFEVWEVYNPNKDYVIGNKVVYDGSSYYCKQNIGATISTTPDVDTDYWVLIVSGGGATDILPAYNKRQGFINVVTGDTIEDAIEKVEGQVQSVVEDLDKTQTQLVVAQNDIKILENTIQSLNPSGDLQITITSFDTVNSLPKNAAQAGLGVVQEGMTATNLVTNGDFSNGTTGWGETASTSSVTNKILSNTGNGAAVSAYVNQVRTFLSGNVYYASAKIRVTNANCVVMRLRTNESSLIFKEQLPPTQNQWYTMSGIITVGSTIPTQIWLQHVYADAATANGKVMEVDGNYGVKVVNLTAIAKQAATLSQADAMLLDYFSGTQSAVTGRVRSVGKNLFDGASSNTDYSFRTSRVWDNGTLTVRNTHGTSSAYSVYTAKIRPNQVYRMKASSERLVGAANGGGILVYNSDITSVLGGNSGALNPNFQFTAPSNGLVRLMFYVDGTLNDVVRFTNIQLELGSTATTYESYRKTESYTKPMPLYRVPNGVADTVENGRYIKRVQRYTIQSADVSLSSVAPTKFDIFAVAITNFIGINTSGWVNDYNGSVTIQGFRGAAYSDVLDNVGTFYLNNTPQIRLCLAKGTSLADARTAIAGKLAQYQLATPVITENVSSGTLLAYPSGTVYWEPVIADVAIYTTGATILNTGYPISSLESIYKIDLVTGEQTPLSVASATVASGGLSFTHTGLSNGDMVGFTYYFSHPYPYGENDYIYYDSHRVIVDSITGITYKWSLTVNNGVPGFNLIPV